MRNSRRCPSKLLSASKTRRLLHKAAKQIRAQTVTDEQPGATRAARGKKSDESSGSSAEDDAGPGRRVWFPWAASVGGALVGRGLLKRQRPVLPNSQETHIAAHFVPLPADDATDLFGDTPGRYRPDPTARTRLAAALRRLGFDVTYTGELFVTAVGSRERYVRVLGLELWRFGPDRVHGFDYPERERPYVGRPRPKDASRVAEWRELGLAGVVFPPVVEFAATGPGDPSRLVTELAAALNLPAAPGQGAGARVTQLDTGRDGTHPFFAQFPADTLAPSDPEPALARSAYHGTQMAAVFKAVAPRAVLTTRSVVASGPAPAQPDDVFDALDRVLAGEPPHVLFAPLILKLPDDLGPLTPLQRAVAVGQLSTLGLLLELAWEKDVLVLFSAGNDCPLQATATHPRAVSVGGTRRGPPRGLTPLTPRGDSVRWPRDADSYCPEVCAPSGDYPTDTVWTVPAPGGTYVAVSGDTSGATAAAAGVAAILKGANPALTVQQLRDAVRRVILAPGHPYLGPLPVWPNW